MIVLIPIWNAGKITERPQQLVLKYQMKTICQGSKSILGRLRREFPLVNLHRYISFYTLRNWGRFSSGEFVTEQVYVHSKTFIADDRVAIVGSANLNDRSLLGLRDSEIAAVIRDAHTEEIDIEKADGSKSKFTVSKLVHEFRIELWKQHLRLDVWDATGTSAKPVNPLTSFRSSAALNAPTATSSATATATAAIIPPQILKIIQDPASEAAYAGLWMDVAAKNTRNYIKVFRKLPYNLHYKRALKYVYEKKKSVHRPERLRRIRGRLVFYPLGFLNRAVIEPTLSASIAGLQLFV